MNAAWRPALRDRVLLVCGLEADGTPRDPQAIAVRAASSRAFSSMSISSMDHTRVPG